MNKIHPLFDQVLSILGIATGPMSQSYFKAWQDAGKPVMEEEPQLTFASPPPILREYLHIAPDGTTTVVIPHLCEKDARIKELEAKQYITFDEIRNAALESVLRWAHEEKDLSRLLDRIRGEVRKT